MLAGEVRRARELGVGAYVEVEDSRRGTRGQLVGGTVEVQVAGKPEISFPQSIDPSSDRRGGDHVAVSSP
jgi:hypothetical protein